jgi:hypothetical protein
MVSNGKKEHERNPFAAQIIFMNFSGRAPVKFTETLLPSGYKEQPLDGQEIRESNNAQ